jgi:hypothetical protein
MWFGEMLPPAAGSRVRLPTPATSSRSASGCGTTVTGARRRSEARHRRLRRSPLTARATFVLQGASGEILPALVKAVWPSE